MAHCTEGIYVYIAIDLLLQALVLPVQPNEHHYTGYDHNDQHSRDDFYSKSVTWTHNHGIIRCIFSQSSLISWVCGTRLHCSSYNVSYAIYQKSIVATCVTQALSIGIIILLLTDSPTYNLIVH